MRFGIEDASVDCMLVMRLRARRRVCRRGERGKLERVLMSLSVKSMASWSYSKNSISPALLPSFFLGKKGGGTRERTLATPRFSIAGILWPVVPQKMISMELDLQSVVSVLFSWVTHL